MKIHLLFYVGLLTICSTYAPSINANSTIEPPEEDPVIKQIKLEIDLSRHDKAWDLIQNLDYLKYQYNLQFQHLCLVAGYYSKKKQNKAAQIHRCLGVLTQQSALSFSSNLSFWAHILQKYPNSKIQDAVCKDYKGRKEVEKLCAN